MVELLKERVDIRAKTNKDNPYLFYFTGVSHFLVIIQVGQKFTSPAISGITPR